MGEILVLKLYIAGMTPAARRAISNLEDICAELHPEHGYDIEVIDVLERPQLAEDERIFATPTVMKKLPPPMRSLVGDLSDREQVLVGLELVQR